MPTIFLIRHAENEYVTKGRLAGRLPAIHLNEFGREQSAALSDKLSKVPLKAIYSSPLERCLETAQPLADALKLEIIPREGLIEIDFGEWQGCTLKQLCRRKLWKSVQDNPSRMHFPGGETFISAQLRVVTELEAISKIHKPKDLVACFTHADIIRLALAYYIGTPLDLFQRVAVSPASISTLHLSESETRVLNVNNSVIFGFERHGK